MRVITREHWKIYRSNGWAYACRKLFEKWQSEKSSENGGNQHG